VAVKEGERDVRDCVILGSGRSGTSLAAGVLAQAGYFMGRALYPPDLGNPKGYFEDPEVNAINEDLLAQVLPRRPGGTLGRLLFRGRPADGQRWLARVPLDADVPCPPDIAERITAYTTRRPFCLKDPRFAYTLPAWRPFLGDALLVCVFREPAATAASMVAEARRQPILRSLRLDRRQAIAVWQATYTHILERHRAAGGEWLFVHYAQLLDGSALPHLAARLGCPVDAHFADERLQRSRARGPVPAAAQALYERLCALASTRPAAAEAVAVA
jgi:hypothetical protein